MANALATNDDHISLSLDQPKGKKTTEKKCDHCGTLPEIAGLHALFAICFA